MISSVKVYIDIAVFSAIFMLMQNSYHIKKEWGFYYYEWSGKQRMYRFLRYLRIRLQPWFIQPKCNRNPDPGRWQWTGLCRPDHLPAGEHKYIALLPLDENGENQDGEVFLYRFFQEEGQQPTLENIEDDDEYEIAADAFDELLDSAEYDEVVDGKEL